MFCCSKLSNIGELTLALNKSHLCSSDCSNSSAAKCRENKGEQNHSGALTVDAYFLLVLISSPKCSIDHTSVISPNDDDRSVCCFCIQLLSRVAPLQFSVHLAFSVNGLCSFLNNYKQKELNNKDCVVIVNTLPSDSCDYIIINTRE